MPRDVSGNYSKPDGTTPSSGDALASASYNALMDDIATALTGSVPVNGSKAMTGLLTLSGDPTANLHAATKQYVDSSGNFTTPEAHGTYVDENTDFTTAFEAALATGLRVVGRKGRVYGISNKLELGTNFDLEGCHFKHLTPNTDNKSIIESTTLVKGRVVGCTFDRGATGAYTGNVIPSLDNAMRGVSIAGPGGGADAHLTFVDNEAKGGGFGRGVLLQNLTSGFVAGNHIHDIFGGSSSYTTITDDVIEGLRLTDCIGVNIVANTIHDITTQWTGQAVLFRYNRGIALSGCVRCVITGNTIFNAGQLIDFSGSNANLHCAVSGNTLTDSGERACAFKNATRNCSFVGNTVKNCDIAGVVVSAPAESVASGGISTADCSGGNIISGNTFENIGDGGSAASRASVQILTGHTDYAGYPRGNLVKDNLMFGKNDGSMKYGIYSDVGYGGDPANVAQGNTILEAGTDEMTGIPLNRVHTSRTSDTSGFVSGATTIVEFNEEIEDPFGMHDNSTNPARHAVRTTGNYNIYAKVYWSPQSGGVRALILYVNGAVVSNDQSYVEQRAYDGNEFTQHLILNDFKLSAGDYVELRALQTSGVDTVVIKASKTHFRMCKSGEMLH